jgi:hypothetical protein
MIIYATRKGTASSSFQLHVMSVVILPERDVSLVAAVQQIYRFVVQPNTPL